MTMRWMMSHRSRRLTISGTLVLFTTMAIAQFGVPDAAHARSGGGQRSTANSGTRNTASNNTRNTTNVNNVNSSRNNVNVNKNTNINVDVDAHGGYHGGYYGRPYHPVAAMATTALVVGAMVSVLPSTGCTTVMVGGIGYRQCGATWYQPQYQGTTVVYQVVNAPQ
jgi:hypothetical protein